MRMRGLIAAALAALLAPLEAPAQSSQSMPTEESKRLPPGSTAERTARMAARAAAPAYTKKFDLSGLPKYVPEGKPAGTLRLAGNNYVGDAPLAGWWRDAFNKYQPGIKIELEQLTTAAIAVPSLYLNLADIGVNHEPSFYDYLGHLRLKGYEPTGIQVFTGSYDIVGWQNQLVIIVNKDNPITKITMKQLDGIFGAARDGGWSGATWHPEWRRGPEGDIRQWGQMGLGGDWAGKRVNVYGYSLRYATALEFSNKVLQASDKWNGDLHAFANYRRPDGTTYLEADQIFDEIRKDPAAIGYARYHGGFPKDVKILAVAQTDAGPYVVPSLETVQNRSYPLWGGQEFWVSVKPGTKMDPKAREFIRFVLSREGQELVQKDGKYLPLTAEVVREELKKLD
jgi:phosphate transport system substrate-binding protein